jgi:predicted acetyltransferase
MGDVTTELTIRTGTADDYPGVDQLMGTVFHRATRDEETTAIWRDLYEPDRALLVEDGGVVVAHAAAYTRELSIPGGVLPAAHVSMVGVAPTHRRRRLLTRLMRRQLAEVPEPIAVLWATEGRIYPRFGYGMATRQLSFTVDNREARLPDDTRAGRLQNTTAAESRPELERVYEAARRDRPGWSSRDGRWWARRFADPPDSRDGASELRITRHQADDGVDGYALWRGKLNWGGGGPEGEVRVEELVATNLDAYLALWRFLFSVDLTRTVKLDPPFGSPDEPLLHLVNEPNQLQSRLGDGLYVRLVDLPAALSARRYATHLDLVIEVTDPLLPENTGRWRLVADLEKANCTRTDAPADLACGMVELGAAYLGGTSLGALAAAGRVRELTPGALPAASAAFGWHLTPYSIEIF